MTEAPTAARRAPVAADDLAPALAALDVALPPRAAEQLAAYLALLAKWNRTYNLTAIRDGARMVTHHVVDSLAALPALDRYAPREGAVRVLDVGSGGGLPGIPLAIARPAWRVTLCEANQKKAAFLTQAAIELGLANVAVVRERVEEARAIPPCAIVVSRAFADLATFAAQSARHVAPGGVLVALKGVDPAGERAALPAAVEVVETIALAVPGVDAARHLVVMRPRASLR